MSDSPFSFVFLAAKIVIVLLLSGAFVFVGSAFAVAGWRVAVAHPWVVPAAIPMVAAWLWAARGRSPSTPVRVGIAIAVQAGSLIVVQAVAG